MKNKESLWAMLAMFLMIALFACLSACTAIPEEIPPNPRPFELSQKEWEELYWFWYMNHQSINRYK